MSTVRLVPFRCKHGRIAYRPLNGVRALGEADESNVPGGISIAQSAVSLISNVQDQVGSKPTNKTLNEVSAVAGKVAMIAPYFGPVGAVVGAVAGVVAVAAKVLSGVFGDTSIDAHVRDLRNTNDNLYDQVATLDDQIRKVTLALNQLDQVLESNGFQITAPSGLGSHLGSDLESEQAMNNDLTNQLAMKGRQLQDLIDTYTTTINQVYEAIRLRNLGRKIILFGLSALALGGLTWYLVREIQGKEEKEKK